MQSYLLSLDARLGESKPSPIFPPGRTLLFPNCSRPVSRPCSWPSSSPSASSTQHMVPHTIGQLYTVHGPPAPSASSTQHMVPHTIGQLYTVHGPPAPSASSTQHMVPLTIEQFYTWSATLSASSTHGPPDNRAILHMVPPHNRTILHNTWFPLTIGHLETERRKHNTK